MFAPKEDNQISAQTSSLIDFANCFKSLSKKGCTSDDETHIDSSKQIQNIEINQEKLVQINIEKCEKEFDSQFSKIQQKDS